MLPKYRTGEEILDDMITKGNFHPKNNLEESLPYFLEVLLDIRDCLRDLNKERYDF